MAELYLRDLNEDLKEQFIREWKREGREDLLKLVEEDKEDIVVGKYYRTEDCRQC